MAGLFVPSSALPNAAGTVEAVVAQPLVKSLTVRNLNAARFGSIWLPELIGLIGPSGVK